MTLILLAFVASFLFVFLKAFQQLNVHHGEYLWIMPISMSMAACEVYVTWQAATRGWGWIILPIGLGAGFGCMAGMALHKYLRSLRKGKPT
jgi:hypothetical protein